jgi:drug/metabolite transporter (DMT)-like permease
VPLVDRLPPFFVASVGMVLLTVMDATVKSLSGSYSTAQIVFVRFLLIGLIIGAMVASARQSWPPARRLTIHFGRALLMLITSSTFFYALGHLPLADVFVLSLTSPIFIALFAALFLKEHVKPAVAIAILAGFAGVLVMVFGAGVRGDRSYEPYALFCALVSPVTYALGIVLLRAQTASEPVTVILATQAMMVAALVSPAAAIAPVVPTSNDVLAFAAVGVLGALGHLAFGNGLKRMPAAKFAMIEYTGVIWAALLGYAFFNETPRATAWIGAGLIVAACLIVVRNRASPPPPAADATSDDAAAAGQNKRA